MKQEPLLAAAMHAHLIFSGLGCFNMAAGQSKVALRPRRTAPLQHTTAEANKTDISVWARSGTAWAAIIATKPELMVSFEDEKTLQHIQGRFQTEKAPPRPLAPMP